MRLTSLTRVRPMRLHPLTWLAGLFVGTILVLITLPGTKWDPYTDHVDHQWHDLACFDAYVAAGGKFGRHSPWQPEEVRVYAHGWPFAALVRTRRRPSESLFGGWTKPQIRLNAPSKLDSLLGPPYIGISWSNADNWPFRWDQVDIRYGYLAMNLLTVLAILATAVGGTELWVRRRGGVFRFRILDFVVGVAVIAAVLGWRQWHVVCQRAEMGIANELDLPHPTSTSFFIDGFSTGPIWLEKLVGNEELVPLCLHHVEVVWIAQLSPNRAARMGELPYLKGVVASGPFTPKEIEALGAIKQLEYLDLSYPGPDEGYDASYVTELLRLGRPMPGEIDALCNLPIGTLTLNAPTLTLSDLEKLARCPTLRILRLGRVNITDEEMAVFRRRHPHLRVLH